MGAFELSEPISDLNTSVVAIAYYLYRQAGCPLGDNVAGLDAWHRASIIEPFRQLAEREVPP